jgi:hypothetical protein
LPVEGPEVNVDFVPVEYIWLSDAMPYISPEFAADAPPEAATFNYANDPPFGF